jgi:transposase-like protein
LLSHSSNIDQILFGIVNKENLKVKMEIFEENSTDSIDYFVEAEEDNIQESNSGKIAKQRRKNFATYTEKDVQEAIEEIQTKKINLCQAAKKFNIPKTTLHQRLKGTSNKHGNSPILSAETEKELAEWIIRCAKIGDPRTRDELLNAASELAKLSPDEHKQFKNDVPSSCWLKGFFKRNPNMSFRTPSTVTKAAANVSKSDILKFHKDFSEWLDENNFRHVFENPLQVGNGDESGFELNPVPSKVLAETGQKQVYCRAVGNPKEQVSVMCNFLASGHVLPHQLILKKSVNQIKVAYSAKGNSFINNFV